MDELLSNVLELLFLPVFDIPTKGVNFVKNVNNGGSARYIMLTPSSQHYFVKIRILQPGFVEFEGDARVNVHFPPF